MPRKILFIFPREKPYNSSSVRLEPSGGTEKAVIFLGEAFEKLGYQVQTISTIAECQELASNPPESDIVITQLAELLELFPKAHRVWWTHHFADQPVIQQQAAYGRCFADTVVTLSRCHREDFAQNLRIPSVMIGHGVWLDEIAEGKEDPCRLIYASTPFRGLELIPDLFRDLKKREPRATIAVCSSMATYGEGSKDAQYKAIFDELATIDGVELLGALNQADLYREYAKASIFLYPCIWPETYCIAMDEAMAHGCGQVIPMIGALPERALASNFENDDWLDKVLFFFSNPGKRGLNKPVDWLNIAKQWEMEVLNNG